MKFTTLSYLIGILMLLSAGCNQDPNNKSVIKNTPTTGKLRIAADETLQPIIKAQIDTFHSLYKYADIQAEYVPEAEALKMLYDDSLRVVIIARDLSKEELDYFKTKKLTARKVKIAYDAIALIINPDNPNKELSRKEISNILTGETSDWNQINKTDNLSEINIVFDNTGSSTVRFISDSLLNGKSITQNAYAAKSNTEVIDYVAENKNALGIIGVNRISDFDDQQAVSFLDKIKVVAINAKNKPTHFFEPYQAYIATKEYPLIREVFVISTEARAGLGTGFASFLAGDKGQRIILKSGLVPANMPIRLVQVKNENFEIK